MVTIFWISFVILLMASLGVGIKIYFEGKSTQPNSFRQSLDLTGLPIITFYQGETKLNFLIDTGSTGCHIDSRYIPKDAVAIKQTQVMGMEGNYQEAPIYAVAVWLNDQKYTVECLASDLTNAFDNIKQEYGVTLHGIMGSNLFSTYKAIIDFEKYVFYFKKRK